MAPYAYRHVVANEWTCYWLLHGLRWPNRVRCPRCQTPRVWRTDDRGRCEYRCKACGYHFSLLTGTALQGTRLPLTKWVLAVALFKVGISSHALARELQVSQRIAWRLLTRFRQVLRRNSLLRKLRGFRKTPGTQEIAEAASIILTIACSTSSGQEDNSSSVTDLR